MSILLVERNNFIRFEIELNIKVFDVSFHSEQITFYIVQFSLECVLLRHYYSHFKPYLFKIVLLLFLLIVHLLDFIFVGLLIYEEFSDVFFSLFVIVLVVLENISFLPQSFIFFDQLLLLFLNNITFYKSLVEFILFLFMNFFQIFYITNNGHQQFLSF